MTDKTKTYDVIVEGKIVGYVEVDSMLIRPLDEADTYLGALLTVEGKNVVLADLPHHDNSLDGKEWQTWVAPTYR